MCEASTCINCDSSVSKKNGTFFVNKFSIISTLLIITNDYFFANFPLSVEMLKPYIENIEEHSMLRTVFSMTLLIYADYQYVTMFPVLL